MQTYRGIVRDRVIVLPEDVSLDEGTTVEIRVIPSSGEDERRLTPESPLARRLIASGLMREVKPPLSSAPHADRTPIVVRGEPLSEFIIRERR